ncbi:MAG TPA: L-seryl-tRNA(Sec) selenium transferase [Deltaproteobacteria bacterium]|nr:MAG: L-seryl-tRNA(Sec) selenium transferase [Deltaproteobacteria bacterium GWA2_65_63]OGP28428.1 MAG: L-seryl-tRNA(Sec) selenium transferase [Deltaproteobacteria bacterium GWB2_65_81]OGP35971.1 MAG: L-seryl-tRNA(Sec) selenium transferase [Deltaproteobacteria bacterium GWC2_66_88]OGP78407.1 MAG: L-seryl-tRNA(Sec) selenium transferase [Deltaproteobacteria bacterium RBG_16_66_15]HAM32809.1 L-seryl-tRNA(Sec) selenium transferase [Deltaproteobacteria bacterium]
MPDPRALRTLPSVASLLASAAAGGFLRSHPRAVVLGALRDLLGVARAGIGEERVFLSREEWSDRILSMLPGELASREALPMRRVINASGVIVHTNLGRAPLPEEAVAAVVDTARGYSNLEFDLAEGKRSSRLSLVEGMLRARTGAECAHVVNNNAAAVLLCLAGHARGRDVIVSRGELVEIGGSFRIPDIMAESGARLVEVGTTNRTRLSDYENAVTGQTALLLKVRRSNFSIHGFTEEVRTADLARLGERAGIPVMEDQGSGALIDLSPHGIPGAESLRQALSAGPGIVTASGDKLLGGPQAGIILGKEDLVAPLKTHPLSRAVRVDKMCLAALSAVLRLHADERRARERVPVLRMLLEPEGRVRARARRLMRALRASGTVLSLAIERGGTSPGGGALPDIFLPTACVAVSHPRIPEEAMEERLRRGTPPVVARIGKGKVLIDLRTVRDDEVPELAAAVLDAGKND